MRFRYHPEAEEELLHSIRYYERKAAGLGAEFLDEVEKTLALIQFFPDLGTLLTDTDRRCWWKDFRMELFTQSMKIMS